MKFESRRYTMLQWVYHRFAEEGARAPRWLVAGGKAWKEVEQESSDKAD